LRDDAGSVSAKDGGTVAMPGNDVATTVITAWSLIAAGRESTAEPIRKSPVFMQCWHFRPFMFRLTM